MKKIIMLAMMAATFVACNKSGYTIDGETKGFEDGTVVYMLQPTDYELVKKDSTKIEQGTFTFKGEDLKEMDYRFIQIGTDDAPHYVSFVLENGNIKVVAEKDKPEDNEVTGTENNDQFTAFLKKQAPLVKDLEKFQIENKERYVKALQDKDSVTLGKVEEELNKKQEVLETEVKKFIDENNSFIAFLMLTSKTGLYSEDELNKKLESFPEDVKKTTAWKNFEKSREEYKKMKETADAAGVKEGDKAIDFTAETPEGTKTSLYANLGKVTVVDFWASWCGPCRLENPNMVKLYNKYKDKGLKIVGVSLDEKADKWKEAIKKDGLVWTQVSNLKSWSDPIAKEYGVQSIPAIFVLDENGMVVAKDLRGEDLEKKVAELLK